MAVRALRDVALRRFNFQLTGGLSPQDAKPGCLGDPGLAEAADRAMLAKATMADALGMSVHVCGTKKDGSGLGK